MFDSPKGPELQPKLLITVKSGIRFVRKTDGSFRLEMLEQPKLDADLRREMAKAKRDKQRRWKDKKEEKEIQKCLKDAVEAGSLISVRHSQDRPRTLDLHRPSLTSGLESSRSSIPLPKTFARRSHLRSVHYLFAYFSQFSGLLVQ